MITINDPRPRAEIEAAIAAHKAALDAHRLTIGVPAPLADAVVDRLARSGEEWALQEEIPEEAGPELTLDDVKRQRQAHINARRDAVIASGVVFNGWTFDTDAASINNLTAAVAFLQAAPAVQIPTPETVSWRDATNTDRDLTKAQLVGLGAAIFAQVQAAHFTARSLKDTIAAARSVDAVMAIDWPA